MFGIDSSELAVIALVALVVIGPKDLPRVMRFLGQWMGKARAMSRHVRSGFDEMMRQAELEEMEKQWKAQNEAIMRATQAPDLMAPPATPATEAASAAAEPSAVTPAEPPVQPAGPAHAG
jgi:sec-independent protein translocase protein TatB